jgi:hypothetical protein
MIFTKDDCLNSEQCVSIIAAAEQSGFAPAGLSGIDKTFYDKNIRDGLVSFIDFDMLSNDTTDAIKNTLIEYNKTPQIFIDEYSLQVAKYDENQIGFKWHVDDKFYPNTGSQWKGRKITAIFELSNPSDYQGGRLEVSPELTTLLPAAYTQNNAYTDDKNIITKTVYHPVQYVGEIPVEPIEVNDNKQSYSNNLMSDTTVYSSKKEGCSIIFPSFLYHRVTPIISGTRYSLTVWCKGPRWS